MPLLNLAPGFTAAPDSGEPSCFHTQLGDVLAGSVAGTFDGTGQVIATLSDGGVAGTYRPPRTRRCPVAVDTAGTASAGYVEVGPTGDVKVYATGDLVSLDGALYSMGR